jgi:hypothetical protein
MTAEANSTLKKRPNDADGVARVALDKALTDRLDKQYGRIFEVVNLVHTIKMAVDGKNESGEDDDFVAMWSSLHFIQDMLLDIADQLARLKLLKPEAQS